MPTPHQIPKGFIEVGIRHSPIVTELKPILLAISNIAKVMSQDQNPRHTTITLYSKIGGQEEVLSVQGTYEHIIADIKKQSQSS